jgi:hypothetical protein
MSQGVAKQANRDIVGGKFEGGLARFFSPPGSGPAFYRGVGFMPMWKTIEIIVVAWVVSVLVYVEFFKAR